MDGMLFCTRLILFEGIFIKLLFMQALPVFTFSNQAGLDMLETTLVALQDTPLEKIFDDHGRKILFSEFPQIIQQVYNFVVIKALIPLPYGLLLDVFPPYMYGYIFLVCVV